MPFRRSLAAASTFTVLATAGCSRSETTEDVDFPGHSGYPADDLHVELECKDYDYPKDFQGEFEDPDQMAGGGVHATLRTCIGVATGHGWVFDKRFGVVSIEVVDGEQYVTPSVEDITLLTGDSSTASGQRQRQTGMRTKWDFALNGKAATTGPAYCGAAGSDDNDGKVVATVAISFNPEQNIKQQATVTRSIERSDIC